MADFSFSFDSDNPFAEPEAVPKPVPTTSTSAPTDEPANDAPTTSTSAPNDFSFEALDFAFDEETSTDDSLPTQMSPAEETAPRQKTPGELAFDEFDFGTSELSDPETTATETKFAENDDNSSVETNAKPTENAVGDLDEFNAFNFGDGNLSGEMSAESANDADISPIVNEFEADLSNFTLDVEQSDFDNADESIEPANEIGAPAEVSSSELSSIDMGVAGVISAQDADSNASDAGADFRSEARPRRLKAALNVAILGASGIGKNHARWFHRNGCHIVGFLGTSDASTAQTQAELRAEFGFDGNSYTDLSELLRQEKPDIVCVATPPALHFGHVLQSLEAGAHVLCEKPLVYAPTRKFRENRDGAKELVKVAAKRNLMLGTQLQYGAATPILCKLAGLSPADVGDFAMELETVNPGSARDPRELWIDMGPHPISIAQMLAGPGAALAEEIIRFEPYRDDEKTEVLARFGVNCADGRLLMVRAVVRCLRESKRQPRRRFSFNGHSVTYAPLQGAKGNFQAQFVAPDGYASVYADPVDYLISDFVRACREDDYPLISGDFGRENLEWMLKVAGDK